MPGLFRRPPQPTQRRKLSQPATPFVPVTYRDAINALNPIGYWRFGEPSGTTAFAQAGPDLAYVGSPTLSISGPMDPSDNDTAVLLSRASSQYAFIASTTLATTTAVSVATWFQFTSTPGAGEVHTLLSWGDQSASVGYHFLYYDRDEAAIRWQYADGGVQFESYPWTLDTNGHFLVVTHDYTNELVKFYLDGDLVGTASTSGTEIAVTTGKPLRWGGYVGGGNLLNATLDDSAIFNYALNDTEIAGLYRLAFESGGLDEYEAAVEALTPRTYWRLGEASGTTAVDEMGVSNGTYNNSPAKPVAGLIGGDFDTAVQFDGTNKSITGAADSIGLSATDAFTVVAWFKRLGAAGGASADYHTIIGRWTGFSEERLLVDSTGTSVLFQHYDQTSTVQNHFSGTTTFEDGARHMLVATFSGSASGTLRQYIDGVESGTALTGINGTQMEGGENWIIGTYVDGANYFANGVIDDVAVFNTALTLAQIENLYSLGLGAGTTVSGTSAAAQLASGTGSALAASIRISANALIVTGTGSALAASAKISANAAAATGTGAAGDVDELTSVTGVGTATGTGSALNVIPLIKPNAGLSSGTGSAHSPPVKIDPRPSAATGTGAADNASIHIKPNAGIAAGTGTANNATGVPNELTSAELASGTGSALGASIHIQPTALLASGTGAAGAAWANIAPNASLASGTGTAYDATASVTASVSASAEVATGTGSAGNASIHVKPNAGLTSGTGTANQPYVAIAPRAEAASGTGTAHNAAAGKYAVAEAATGTGSASNASVKISPNAGLVSGTGSANAASDLIKPNALLSSGTGAAGQVSAHIQPIAGVSSGTGAANNATVLTAEYRYAAAELASGTGSAGQASASIAAHVSSAYRDATLALDPIGYWRFGDSAGTVATAEVGPNLAYGNTPTLGAVGLLTGDANTGVTFSRASSEYASVASTSLASGADGVSVAAWVKFGSLSAGEVHGLLSWGNQAGAIGFHFWYYDVDTGEIAWQYANGGVQTERYPWAADAGAHLWVVSHDYTNELVKFYLDGDLVGTAPTTGTLSVATGQPLRWAQYVGGSSSANATIDEPAIFDTVLSAADIEALYRIGSGLGTVGVANSASAHVQPNAALAAGTGTAYNATAATTSAVNVNPEVASGSGAANNASVLLAPNAELDTGTGSANSTSGHVAPRAGAAAGTGQANDATVLATEYRSASAQVASGTGAANNATPLVAPNAGLASGTGAAFNATATAVQYRSADAELASGVGAALNATTAIAVNALAASGTGAANDATAQTAAATNATAEAASGTGSAFDVTTDIKASAITATGTGTAYDAAASTTSNVYASAEAATGTGAAGQISAAIAPNAEPALGLGGAAGASASVAPSAGSAGGSGAAQGASSTVSGSAAPATGTGQSTGASAAIAVNAELATGSGSAHNATAFTGAQVLRPIADLSGNWHGEDARTTNLYTSVDDDPFEDATYVESPSSPTSSDFHEFDLPTAGDPFSSEGHIVRYRYGGEGTATLVVELRQGATVIASWQHVNPTTPTLAEQTLTAGEADAITDYSDLRIRVRAA